MFSNIGKKIKTLVKVVFWIMFVIFILFAIASVIAGAVMIASRKNDIGNGIAVIFGGLFGSALMILLTWVGMFFAYGFGELCDSTSRLADKFAPEYPAGMYPTQQPVQPQQPPRPAQPQTAYAAPVVAVKPQPAPAPQPAPQPEPPKPAEPPKPEEPKPASEAICTNCGAKLAPGTVFCTNCGSKQ